MTEKKTEQQLYIVGWICLAAFAVFFAAAEWTDYRIFAYMPDCAFYRLTGLYCPGCGGTRALFLLMRGELLGSFLFHPTVPYTVLLGGWFMISQTAERLSRGRIRIAMRFRERYLWIALAITVANCLVKNLVLVVWHAALPVRL